MGGGLLQLLTNGAQDQYLTGNPAVTFFKSVYRQYTNFSMESIKLDINGSIESGTKVTFNVPRHADLLTNCWIEFKLLEGSPKPKLGHSFLSCFKTIELEIGGQKIDKHTGDWLRIWSELSLPAEKKEAYDRLVNQTDEINLNQDLISSGIFNASSGKMSPELHSNLETFYVPLQFFFCKNPGLALPLLSMQYHETKIIIEFNEFDTYTQQYGSGLQDVDVRIQRGHDKSYINLSNYEVNIYGNYIFLDYDERKRFIESSHQILIEQVQYVTTNLSASTKLNFNHPIKELVWVVQTEKQGKDYSILDNDGNVVSSYVKKTGFGYYDYDGDENAFHSQEIMNNSLLNSQKFINSVLLKLNSQDRFAEQIIDWFRYVQTYQYHTRVPRIPIYVYSFSLRPEDHQPSGTCNFSRIDNAYLNFDINRTIDAENTGDIILKIFAVGYNILKVTSGMAGLVFAN